MNAFLTPEELQAELSENYTGKEELYAYDGDLYLDFMGGNSFSDMKKSTKRLGYSIKNDTTTQKVIAISTGSYSTIAMAAVYDDAGTLKYKHPNGGGALVAPAGSVVGQILVFESATGDIIAAGHNIDAVLDDGVIYSESADPTKKILVTPAQKNLTIKHFRGYIKNNPTFFTGIHVGSTDEAMYDTSIISKRVNPYGVDAETALPLQDFFDPKNTNTKKIIVPRELQMDSETLILITVPSGALVTLTFVAGVVESAGHALKKKVASSKDGIKRLPKRKF